MEDLRVLFERSKGIRREAFTGTIFFSNGEEIGRVYGRWFEFNNRIVLLDGEEYIILCLTKYLSTPDEAEIMDLKTYNESVYIKVE